MTAALLAIGVADLRAVAGLAAARSGIAERLKAAKATLKSKTPGETTIGLNRPGSPAQPCRCRSEPAGGRTRDFELGGVIDHGRSGCRSRGGQEGRRGGG